MSDGVWRDGNGDGGGDVGRGVRVDLELHGGVLAMLTMELMVDRTDEEISRELADEKIGMELRTLQVV